MAPLSESLLPVGGQPTPATRKQTTAFAVTMVGSAVVASSLVALFAASEFGRQTPHDQGAFPVSLAGSNLTAQGGPTSLWAASLTSKCYGITGGTCNVEDCNAWRGAACQYGSCVCRPGTCSGADGVCHHRKNHLAAQAFTLTNVKYSSSRLYMPALSSFNQMEVSSTSLFLPAGSDTFDLYELPGKVNGHRAFILTTQRYPDYAASIQPTTGTAFSLFGVYEKQLSSQYGASTISVRVCKKDAGQLMIGSAGEGATSWFYIHHGSWNVYGWTLSSDPGPGGYWQASPPIPDHYLAPCPA